MKTVLISFLAATLMGFAAHAIERSIGAVELASVLIAAGLVAWTIKQYSRPSLRLAASKPIHLPLRLKAEPLPAHPQKLAA